MADPIRPSLPNLTPTRPQGAPGEAARAAQRAFFAQAMNGVQAQAAEPMQAPARPATAEPVRAQLHVDRINIPAEPPERPTRPGAYLDVKV